MRACGRHLEPGAFGGGDEFPARAVHFNAKLAHVFADARAGLNDGLMQLVFYLLRDVRRSRRDELANVRTQFARRGINDLELFLDADSEAVSHGLGPLDLLVLSGTSNFVSYRDAAQNTPMPRACRATICFEREKGRQKCLSHRRLVGLDPSLLDRLA